MQVLFIFKNLFKKNEDPGIAVAVHTGLLVRSSLLAVRRIGNVSVVCETTAEPLF